MKTCICGLQYEPISNKTGVKKCPECRRAYERDYYEKNKLTMRPSRIKRSQDIIKQYRDKIINYLEDHPCIDCKESDIVVLEFDHREGTIKVDNISTMVTNRFSWIKIKEEIDKCDVRCANCHRRKTAKQFNYYRQIH